MIRSFQVEKELLCQPVDQEFEQSSILWPLMIALTGVGAAVIPESVSAGSDIVTDAAPAAGQGDHQWQSIEDCSNS